MLLLSENDIAGLCMHAKDIVHCDIKPSNIVYVNGRPKLADIGLVAGSGVASGEASEKKKA